MSELRSGTSIDGFRKRFGEIKGHFHAPFDVGHGMATRPNGPQRGRLIVHIFAR
jgi:hypothetical protein